MEKVISDRSIIVNGPVIIGAGPSGLAIGAALKKEGVPFIILEKANCIASLWQNKTYDRLKLHLPKQFCQLPFLPFPKHFPEYPTRNQFIDYLKSYAKLFEIRPRFNESVYSAKYDTKCDMWRINTNDNNNNRAMIKMEYMCKWIVVATGENAEKVMPKFEGIQDFSGHVMHACEYKSGNAFEGKHVLVVGCGNTGMEVSLDLSNHNAIPSMVVRNPVHVLPREILGTSTFGVAIMLMKWLPIRVVDNILLIAAKLILGDLEKHGIKRPSIGPLELKHTQGKTPVLDVGTSMKIGSGQIKIIPVGIKRFTGSNGVELVNGEILDNIDSVIMATGYRSNVPSWLKEEEEEEEDEFFGEDGYPRTPYPNGWKGKRGLYAVGFSRRGVLGASFDAIRVAQDITKMWKQRFEYPELF